MINHRLFIAFLSLLSFPSFANEPIQQDNPCYLAFDSDTRRLMYTTQFSLSPSEKSRMSAFQTTTKLIRRWVQSKAEEFEHLLGNGDYFRGGNFEVVDKKKIVHSLQTGATIGLGDRMFPQYWGITYRHSCGHCKFEYWETQIGLTRTKSEEIQIKISIYHGAIKNPDGYVLPDADPAPPRLVKFLLGSHFLKASIGDLLLQENPIMLSTGEAMYFREILELKNRATIVLISNDSQTGSIISPYELAKKLTGIALVFFVDPESPDFAKELSYVITKKKHRPTNGAIKIYRPGVELDDVDNARHHPIYLPKDLLDDPDQALANIELRVKQIAKRNFGMVGNAQEAIDQDQTIVMERMRKELAEKRHHNNVFDANEVEEILDQNNQLVESLNLERTRRRSTEESLEKEREEHGSLRSTYAHIRAKLEKSSRQNDVMQQSITQLQTISELPRNVEDVMGKMLEIFPNRLFFTEKGKARMKRAKYQDSHDVWKALWILAQDIHPIIFDKNISSSQEIANKVKEVTGYEISFSESSTTRDQTKFMELRTDDYLGKKVTAMAHIKWSSAQYRLRFYFYIDKSNEKLVIVGGPDHLDTAGTRRMNKSR